MICKEWISKSCWDFKAVNLLLSPSSCKELQTPHKQTCDSLPVSNVTETGSGSNGKTKDITAINLNSADSLPLYRRDPTAESL